MLRSFFFFLLFLLGMSTSLTFGGVSDGTFTQDPHMLERCTLTLQHEHQQRSPVLTQQQLFCEEMECRTRLACDALTDFQRIVSLCVSERFGRWTFSMTSSAPMVAGGRGWCCPRCGFTEGDALCTTAPAGATSGGRNSEAAKVRGLFACDSCRTPLCSAEELRASSNRCQYAADAAALLERRFTFQQDFGGLLQRIHAASRGIQDSVTR